MKILRNENKDTISFELYPHNKKELEQLERLGIEDYATTEFIASIVPAFEAVNKKIKGLLFSVYFELPNYNRIVLIHLKTHVK